MRVPLECIVQPIHPETGIASHSMTAYVWFTASLSLLCVEPGNAGPRHWLIAGHRSVSRDMGQGARGVMMAAAVHANFMRKIG